MNNISLTTILYILGIIFAVIIAGKILSGLFSFGAIIAVILVVLYILYSIYNILIK